MAGMSYADQFLAATFAFLAIAWVAYACRLYTRLCIVQKTFADDYFVTFAMIALTIFAATVPIQIAHGGGTHIVDIQDPAQNLPKWGLAFFVAEIMYLLTLWGVKLSVASLLLRFAMSKTLSWTLKLAAAFTTIITLAFVLWLTFQCKPVDAQWNTSIAGDCVSRQTYANSVYALSSFSAITDLITAVAPMIILRNLTMDRRSRWACVVTFIRFKFIRDFTKSDDGTYAMVPLSICSFVEVSIGCICASLATLRPLLQRLWRDRSVADIRTTELAMDPPVKFSFESKQLQQGWELAHGKRTKNGAHAFIIHDDHNRHFNLDTT
nr:hypothetical protein CFP56_70101 [Quercus suber]